MVKLQALNIPIRQWVPSWLGFVTALVIMLPIVLINGAYTGDITEVSGTLGVLNEDIRMGYYATSVGMAVSYPLIPKIRGALNTKTIFLSDLLLQAILSLVCAQVTQIDIIIVCSFFIGFLKGFAMLEIILMIRPFFSPANVRSEFYAYFYPIVFSAGQISMVLTAQLAYHYQWQHMYYFVVILLLLAIIFVLFFFRYAPTTIHIPWKETDGKSLLLAATSQLFIIYIFTYGKTLDWFSSPKIIAYTLITPFLIWLFFFRQNTCQKPYIRLEALKRLKAVVGYLFMVITMFFSSSSSLITSYVTNILHLDSVHTSTLNLWMIPGFIAGGVVCFWWFRWQKWRFRFLISGSMFCFALYFGIFYFNVSINGTYEILYLLMFLRGIGMMVSFIAFGVYIVEDMDPKLMIYNAFFLITLRSALAPALSTSFYTTILYHLQLNAMNILSESMTMDNTVASSPYLQSLHNAIAQGHSSSEANQLAVHSLYITLQSQSLLLGLKIFIGYLLITALAIAVISCFIPFHKTLKVKVVKTGEDMV